MTTLGQTPRTTPRPVTAARMRAKDTYAAIMRERLGFVPKDCEYQIGSGPITRCPLYDLCGQLVRQQEAVFCELSDEELGIVALKPTGVPEQEEIDEVLWLDAIMPVDRDVLQSVIY